MVDSSYNACKLYTAVCVLLFNMFNNIIITNIYGEQFCSAIGAPYLFS